MLSSNVIFSNTALKVNFKTEVFKTNKNSLSAIFGESSNVQKKVTSSKFSVESEITAYTWP